PGGRGGEPGARRRTSGGPCAGSVAAPVARRPRRDGRCGERGGRRTPAPATLDRCDRILPDATPSRANSPMTHRPLQPPHAFAGGTSRTLRGLFGVGASEGLEVGRLGAPGPGLFPRVLSVGVLATGLALVILSLVRKGEALGRWPLRGPFFICLAVLAFALTIRTPGLAVAGPAMVMVSGAASPETRWRGLAIYSLAITGGCGLLFPVLLRLPVPILVIPGVVVY